MRSVMGRFAFKYLRQASLPGRRYLPWPPCIFVGLDPGDTDHADHLPIDNYRHATIQRGKQWCTEGNATSAVDHVFVAFGFTTPKGGAYGFFGGDIGADRRAAIQALQGQRMAAVVDNGNSDGPALLLRFGTRGGKDLADFGLAQYGLVSIDKIVLVDHSSADARCAGKSAWRQKASGMGNAAQEILHPLVSRVAQDFRRRALSNDGTAF